MQRYRLSRTSHSLSQLKKEAFMVLVEARKRMFGFIGRLLAGALARWTLDKMFEQLVSI